MKKIALLTLLLAFSVGICRADEGMWLPSLISSRIKDMQSKGFNLTAKDLYDVNQASMKDAVMKFGNGCSAELISAQGLILTNHHCGYGEIQKHSTLEHDYLTNGFWAMSRAEELPNPGLTVTFLVRMDDVTGRVMEGVTRQMSPTEQASKINKNRAMIAQKAVAGTHYTAAVESFYYGNQYFLFIYEVFEDVRLVGAPPSSIGKFGGDTDNWMWPRHTGDFSLFRIYASPDNKPAKYSKNNVPYTPKKHFTISTKTIKEGDFTFIYGLPARTNEYLVSDAVDYILNRSNPDKIALRTMRLDVIREASDADPLTRIKYASKAAGIANAWKKWQGESKGIARLKTIERKQREEAVFQTWADALPASNPYAADYRRVLPELRRLYKELSDYAYARDYYLEAFMGIEIFKFADELYNAKDEAGARKLAETFYKDYSVEIDKKVAVKLMGEYLRNVPARFAPKGMPELIARVSVDTIVNLMFQNTALADAKKFDARAAGSFGESKNLDDLVRMSHREVRKIYDEQIMPRYTALNDSITALYTIYMRGLMEQQPKRDFYPDANFTLRVAYGNVEGYYPEDGMKALPGTTLEGIMAKDNPNIYDYDIPMRLRELYASKDYGRWAENGTVPVAFIATNHTSGGNSGSPVLNGRGELIGLNFDRTWLSTMSDVEFDPTMCRNVAADIRYVLFVIEKVGRAGYLIDEMTLAK